MRISFLGQGFETNSTNAVGNHLIAYLNQTGFHSFTGISAFASESGIFGMSGHIQTALQNFRNITIIVGVDLEGTSKEALEEIQSLNINGYIFYQSEQTVFHPKIYLFEGDTEYKLIIGSSNLTRRGLFINVESSLLIEFDAGDTEGLAFLADLKSYYQTLFNQSDPNLFPINTTTITDFVAKGIVPDETTRKRFYSRKNSGASTTGGATSNSIVIPRRATPRIPGSFPSRPASPAVSVPNQSVVTSSSSPVVAPVQTITPISPLIGRTLVWQKLSLSQSDAQQVPSGTAITANLKLSQARFRVNGVTINQTIYFRNQVFNNLNWVQTKPNNNSYEEAHCQFDITILGNNIGVFTLKLSHDLVRVAGQGNTPTWLHWGNNILPYLQSTNITGRTLNLYSSNQNFSIEIV